MGGSEFLLEGVVAVLLGGGLAVLLDGSLALWHVPCGGNFLWRLRAKLSLAFGAVGGDGWWVSGPRPARTLPACSLLLGCL